MGRPTRRQMQLRMTQLPMMHLQMISASVDTGGTDWLWLAMAEYSRYTAVSEHRSRVQIFRQFLSGLPKELLVLKGAEIFQKYIIEGMTAGAVKG